MMLKKSRGLERHMMSTFTKSRIGIGEPVCSKIVCEDGRYLGIKVALEVYSVSDRHERIPVSSPGADQVAKAERDLKKLFEVIPHISGGFLK